MALQPGRGRTAVPVRSAIFGATLGVAALTASLVLAASLGHLLTTPRLAGFTWDAFVSVEGGLPKAAAALRADPKIAGYTRGGFAGVRIGRVRLMALVLGRPGPARPVITAGVAPTAGDEIALGASTMRAAHTAIGRTVHVVLDQAGGHPKPVRMRVVGTVIVPPTPFLVTKLGEGAAVTLRGYLRIDPDAARQPGRLPFLVRFAPGVSRDAGLAAVASDIKGLPGPYVNAAERPASVVSLASIAGLPVALAGLLALMAAATLAHTLASSTRRRRRDLAILKSLGFARWQLRQAVAWQATTIAGIALLIGLRPASRAAGGRGAISPHSSACCPSRPSRSPRSSSPYPRHSSWRTSSQRPLGRQQHAYRPPPSSGPNRKGRTTAQRRCFTGLVPWRCDPGGLGEPVGAAPGVGGRREYAAGGAGHG